MRKNNISIVIFDCVLIALLVFLCAEVVKNDKLETQIRELESENKELITQLDQLDDTEPLASCQYCGSEVKLNPINDSWYIECANCGLHTTYFSDKHELIRYWNMEDER